MAKRTSFNTSLHYFLLLNFPWHQSPHEDLYYERNFDVPFHFVWPINFPFKKILIKEDKNCRNNCPKTLSSTIFHLRLTHQYQYCLSSPYVLHSLGLPFLFKFLIKLKLQCLARTRRWKPHKRVSIYLYPGISHSKMSIHLFVVPKKKKNPPPKIKEWQITGILHNSSLLTMQFYIPKSTMLLMVLWFWLSAEHIDCLSYHPSFILAKSQGQPSHLSYNILISVPKFAKNWCLKYLFLYYHLL